MAITDKKILILGLGAIGGILAGRLIEAGYSPSLITNNLEITQAIIKNGIQIVGKNGSEKFKSEAYTNLNEIPDNFKFDIIILAMKTDGVVEAAKNSMLLLATNGYFVTIQNGIVEEAVSAVVGKENVVTGIIGWGASMLGPGIYKKTTTGYTFIGEFDNTITNRIKELEALLNTSAQVKVTKNIRGAQWTKLAINSTINSLGVLTGQSLGVMLKNKKTRELFLLCYQEVVDVAVALGFRLEKVTDNDPMLLYRPNNSGPFKRWYKDLLVKFVGRKYSGARSSSLQSLERGRKTEIDFLNGYVIEKARQVGIGTPVNSSLTQFVKDIEEGSRPISPQNIQDLWTEIS